MSNRIYCGNAMMKETPWGERLRIAMTTSDLQTLQKYLSDGWVHIDVNERKQPSEKGYTHYLTVDTWRPASDTPQTSDDAARNSEETNPKQDQLNPTREQLSYGEDSTDDSIPF